MSAAAGIYHRSARGVSTVCSRVIRQVINHRLLGSPVRSARGSAAAGISTVLPAAASEPKLMHLPLSLDDGVTLQDYTFRQVRPLPAWRGGSGSSVSVILILRGEVTGTMAGAWNVGEGWSEQGVR